MKASRDPAGRVPLLGTPRPELDALLGLTDELSGEHATVWPQATPAGDAEDVMYFDDVDSAEETVGELYYPHSIDVAGRSSRFRGRFSAVRLGPILMGQLDYNMGLTMTVPNVEGYHLNMPVQGRLRSISIGRDVDTTPGRGALYRTGSDAVLSTARDCPFDMLAIHIDRRPLENALSALLGRPIAEPVRLAPDLDLRTGAGRQWWELLMAWNALRRRNLLLANPMVAEPLGHSLLTGLLFAAGHQFSDALRIASRSGTSSAVRAAESYIIDHIGEPLTIGDVARRAGLSTRAIQRGFHEQHGMTPKDYIRMRRLERAHADLAMSDPHTATVTAVATRWGFAHLGRFSRDYRAKYGVSPAQTLRS
jgi:AraC-like DNA-binding protein